MITVYDKKPNRRQYSQQKYREEAIHQMVIDSGIGICTKNIEAIERLYDVGYRKGRLRLARRVDAVGD